MDGVDISSSSEFGDEETCEKKNDPGGAGRDSYGSGDNFAMESDVDAELDYDEGNGDDEEESVSEKRQNDDNKNKEKRHGAKQQDVADMTQNDNDEGQVDKTMALCDNGKDEVMEGELSDEGEIDDLEEGELKSDEESITGSRPSTEKSFLKPVLGNHEREFECLSPQRPRRDDSATVGICKFYLRGTCTWGPDCKYLHVKEPRHLNSAQSSSSESMWPQRPDAVKTQNSNYEFAKANINTRVVYPSSSTSNETLSHGDETAWEKGLRQARELMIKASKKREEEPDFERKRLVLAPSEDLDRLRTTDEESDDSHGYRRLRYRTSRSPLSRNVIRGTNMLVGRGRVNAPVPRSKRCDGAVEPNGITGENCHDLESRGGAPNGSGYERRDLAKPRKIPSLIDTMLEGRHFELPRRYDCGRDEPIRIPPKDLGPQVLYPNGRPPVRRRAPFPRREFSPNDRYYVPRRNSVSRSPPIPPLRNSRDSRSPSPLKRRGSSLLTNGKRETNRKRDGAISVGGLLSVGDQIHDPWERGHKKERSKDNELISLTLGAELQKARRERDDRDRKRRSVSSTSRRSASATSTGTSRSRSRSRGSSRCHHNPPSRFSLSAAVVSKNLIDDDGSLRATDLSSFRIPKKKRSSPASSLCRSSTVTNRCYKQPFERPAEQNKRNVSLTPLRRLTSSPKRFTAVQRQKKCSKGGVSGCANKIHKNNVMLPVKEDISSDESSSSTSGDSSSSSDDTEPAAYRLKKKVDDGLPTEGIPLSPEVEAEDVSSDEDEDATETSVQKSVPQYSKTLSSGNLRPPSRKAATAECCESGLDDDDYVDNEAEKEERRAELLRQLKCVEEAIARKRSRPVA